MEVTNIADVSLDEYKSIINEDLYHAILKCVKPYVGKTVVHFNATAIGGGVAEILQGLVCLKIYIFIRIYVIAEY
jgi:hypothetical protein